MKTLILNIKNFNKIPGHGQELSNQFTCWTCLQIVYLREIIQCQRNNPQVVEKEKVIHIFKKQALAC